jgi:hypothetical protein
MRDACRSTERRRDARTTHNPCRRDVRTTHDPAVRHSRCLLVADASRGVSPACRLPSRLGRGCAGAYVFGESGSDSCPAGSITISTAAACEAAASATAVAYDGREYKSGYPAGCYRVTYGDGDSIVYFNTHITGGSTANSQPLCSLEGSAGTPLRPHVALQYCGLVSGFNRRVSCCSAHQRRRHTRARDSQALYRAYSVPIRLSG